MKMTVMTVMMLLVSGCGSNLASQAMPDTPFSSGSSGNPLDKAIVLHDGVAYTLSAPGTIGQVTASDGSVMEFSKENYADLGFPLPVRIVTSKGNSVSIDLETGMLSATLDIPFLGPQTFDFPVDFGSLLTGVSLKATAECTAAEASFDAFCELIDTNADLAADEGVALALQAATDNGVPGIALGIIEKTIRQFLDVPVSFCGAWSNSVPRGVCD